MSITCEPLTLKYLESMLNMVIRERSLNSLRDYHKAIQSTLLKIKSDRDAKCDKFGALISRLSNTIVDENTPEDEPEDEIANPEDEPENEPEDEPENPEDDLEDESENEPEDEPENPEDDPEDESDDDEPKPSTSTCNYPVNDSEAQILLLLYDELKSSRNHIQTLDLIQSVIANILRYKKD